MKSVFQSIVRKYAPSRRLYIHRRKTARALIKILCTTDVVWISKVLTGYIGPVFGSICELYKKVVNPVFDLVLVGIQFKQTTRRALADP